MIALSLTLFDQDDPRNSIRVLLHPEKVFLTPPISSLALSHSSSPLDSTCQFPTPTEVGHIVPGGDGVCRVRWENEPLGRCKVRLTLESVRGLEAIEMDGDDWGSGIDGPRGCVMDSCGFCVM